MSDGITLRPHPYEMKRSIVADHVVVFDDRNGHQFEVSGRTDADDIEVDWSNIELEAEEVEDILGGETYIEKCEDPAGRLYELQVNGGERHPKGTPVHTGVDDDR